MLIYQRVPKYPEVHSSITILTMGLWAVLMIYPIESRYFPNVFPMGKTRTPFSQWPFQEPKYGRIWYSASILGSCFIPIDLELSFLSLRCHDYRLSLPDKFCGFCTQCWSLNSRAADFNQSLCIAAKKHPLYEIISNVCHCILITIYYDPVSW